MDFRSKGFTLAAALLGLAALQPVQAQAPPPPTDPQIVGIVLAANTIDINYGKLALSKTKDQQVHDFAQQMVTDHSAVQKSVMDLGAKLHVTPTASATADSLKKQAAETTAKLKGLSGKAFDRAYVDNEVAYHTAVIDASLEGADPERSERRSEGSPDGRRAFIYRSSGARQNDPVEAEVES